MEAIIPFITGRGSPCGKPHQVIPSRFAEKIRTFGWENCGTRTIFRNCAKGSKLTIQEQVFIPLFTSKLVGKSEPSLFLPEYLW